MLCNVHDGHDYCTHRPHRDQARGSLYVRSVLLRPVLRGSPELHRLSQCCSRPRARSCARCGQSPSSSPVCTTPGASRTSLQVAQARPDLSPVVPCLAAPCTPVGDLSRPRARSSRGVADHFRPRSRIKAAPLSMNCKPRFAKLSDTCNTLQTHSSHVHHLTHPRCLRCIRLRTGHRTLLRVRARLQPAPPPHRPVCRLRLLWRWRRLRVPIRQERRLRCPYQRLPRIPMRVPQRCLHLV